MRVILENSDEIYWMSQEDFPNAIGLEEGYRVKITSLPATDPELTPLVLEFQVLKK